MPENVRRCSCGTRLNRYNANHLCHPCMFKAQTTEAPPAHYPRINNTSGLRGVLRHGDKWKAQRQVNGMKRHLGIFDTAAEAHEAWKQAKAAALLPSDRLGPDHATQVDTP